MTDDGSPTPERPTRPGPIGGDMAAIVHGLATRVSLPALLRRHDRVTVLGLFAMVNGIISIGLMALAALVTGAPFIFPSLGPTAFLLFYTPMLPTACPRNTLAGHAIGAAAGYFALVVFGLQHAGPALATGVTASRVGAAALSLGLTSGLMVWARVPHPPAGATDTDRVARNPSRTMAARRADAGGVPARPPRPRDQPPGRNPLSALEPGHRPHRPDERRPRSLTP